MENKNERKIISYLNFVSIQFGTYFLLFISCNF